MSLPGISSSILIRRFSGIYSDIPPNTVPPRSGPCNLATPSFADLKAANPAAYNLLTATYGNNGASTYAGWGTYNQAVFLNTIGAVAAQEVNLSNARVDGFYYGDSPDRAPFGVEVTGVTTQNLDSAGLGGSSFPGIGRRSPKSIKQGSIEATVHGNTVAFDVDLWNVKSELRKHSDEVSFNKKNKTTTHPADVVRALNGRGVSTGVKCK